MGTKGEQGPACCGQQQQAHGETPEQALDYSELSVTASCRSDLAS